MADSSNYSFSQEHGVYVSELKVMQSAAGFYVGRDCYERGEPEWKIPFSRESDYFATREQAHNCLQITKLENSLGFTANSLFSLSGHCC